MATEILPIAETAANSSDVVVASGDELTVCLKGEHGPSLPLAGLVDVQLKSDAGTYFNIDILKSKRPALLIRAGTYRFARRAGESCGVFSA